MIQTRRLININEIKVCIVFICSLGFFFVYNYESHSLKGTCLVLTSFQLLEKVFLSLSEKRENVKYNFSK